MISIITGDIINSQSAKLPRAYLEQIRKTLTRFGQEGKTWEIFRGDSFQLEVVQAEDAFWISVYIKAALKTSKNLDARMAMGIGEKTYAAKNISEANGSAFVRSGAVFETLKREKSNLLLNTGNLIFDKEINVYIQLALIAMDHWTPNSAEIIKLAIENPTYNQRELGKLIGIKQNTVSERQKRASWDELYAFDAVFRTKIKSL